MNVSSYLFQSPSPQQVQIGRPDPSVAKENTDTQNSSKESSSESVVVPQEVQNIQTKNPEDIALKSMDPTRVLDLYA